MNLLTLCLAWRAMTDLAGGIEEAIMKWKLKIVCIALPDKIGGQLGPSN